MLARERVLRSIALVGSREPIADLWGLGADNVLVREPNLAARLIELGLPQPRLAFDGSGGPISDLLGSCLQVGGELWVYGATTRMPIQLSVDQLVFREIRARGFWLHRWTQTAGAEAVRSKLERLVAAEPLREHVIACFDLADWIEAFDRAELPGARGRVVFRPRS